MKTCDLYPIILFFFAVQSLRADDAYVEYTNALAHIALINAYTPDRDVWAEKADDAKRRLAERARTDTNYLARLYARFVSQKRCSPSAPEHDRLFRGFLSFGLYQILRECSVQLAYEALLASADPHDGHEFSTETIVRTLGNLALYDAATNTLLAQRVWTSVLSYTNHPDQHVRGATIATLLAAQRAGTVPISAAALRAIMTDELERATSVRARAFLYEDFIRRGDGSMKHEYLRWLNALCTNHTVSARDRTFVKEKRSMVAPVQAE